MSDNASRLQDATPAVEAFRKRLSGIRRHQRCARGFLVLAPLVQYAVVLLLLYAAADAMLALSASYRVGVNILFVAGWIALAGIGLFRACRLSLDEAAKGVDAHRADTRRTVQAALDLARRRNGETGLSGYLAGVTIQNAAAALRSLPLRAVYPVREMKRASVRCLLVLAGGLALVVVLSPVSSIVFPRIFRPAEDIPPYSRYVFTINPLRPTVIYGENVEVQAHITGAPVRGSVNMAVRSHGGVYESACFQLGSNTFARALEQVTEPVEFCFKVGRARSHWHGVDLRLQPRVTAARLEIHPPKYTGRAGYAFGAGEQDLAGLPGSSVMLDILSNRPLGSGQLRIMEKNCSNLLETVSGTLTEVHAIQFEWSLDEDACLEVDIQDARGTESRQPLRLTQRIQPDEFPEVVLSEPGPFSLATPKVQVSLSGYAEDDIGLREVLTVKSLVGFRDRPEAVAVEEVTPRVDFKEVLDLAEIGVVPGQVLEFYAEAEDVHPTRMGRSVSEVARIEIISEEDFAEMQRQLIRTEEFLERYREMQEAMNRILEAADQMEKAMEDKTASKGALSERQDKLLQEMEKAQALAQQLADDFPVFDAEERFQEALKETMDALAQTRKELQAEPAGGLASVAAVLRMKILLDSDTSAVKQEIQAAEDIAKVSRLMEMTSDYQRLVNEQAELVRRLDQVRHGSEENMQRLMDWAALREEQIRGQLLQLQAQIREKAEQLPEGFDDLHTTALEFADAMDDVEIPPLLDQARKAAQDRDQVQAMDRAKLALERMQELFSNCSGSFGEMANCSPKFSVPNPRLMPTLRQMMNAWRQGSGSGQGGVGGVGAGGGRSGADGYFMQGASPLNVPMYGPRRTRFAREGMADRNSGKGRGGADAPIQVLNEDEVLSASPANMSNRSEVQLDRVPEKYRSAVKNYFDISTERVEP